MRPLTAPKVLSIVRSDILLDLKHLDLTGRIVSMSTEAVGQGAYSEVFSGREVVQGQNQVEVAIKRIRFHVKSTDCKRVRLQLSPTSSLLRCSLST